MSTHLVSTALAAALALGVTAGSAFAQSAPPSVPTAAAVGASASPLIGQGYLPSAGSREDAAPATWYRLEQRYGTQRVVR